MDKIDQVIETTAKTESGGNYGVWNANDNNAGVSFGLIQFNQGGGRLADQAGSPLAALFKQMNVRSPSKFQQVFGANAQNLLNTAWVKAADLNTADLKARIVSTGSIPEFQQAQRDMARQGYYAPVEKTGKALGLKSQRAYAMLFDTSVQMGPARASTLATGAKAKAGPKATEKQVLAHFATDADDFATTAIRRNAPDAKATVRRTAMLTNPNISDEAMYGIGGALIAGGALLAAFLLWRRR